MSLRRLPRWYSIVFSKWIENEVRDARAMRRLERDIATFREYGLDGFSDKKMLSRFKNIWEIRIHVSPGYRLYAQRDRNGRHMLLGVDFKPREGSEDNYREAIRSAEIAEEINTDLSEN